MDFSLTEEQQLFQNSVRAFVANECPPQTTRAIFDGRRDAGDLWQQLVGIGVAGIVVPEEHGGAGLELLEAALVAEELGRGAVPVAFLGHTLATLAIARGGTASQRTAWLPRLTTGAARATIALGEGDGAWLPDSWRAAHRGGRVSGVKQYVPEADGADVFVVGCDGGALALVEPGPGVRVDPVVASLDHGRPLATLTLEGAVAESLGGDAMQLVDAGCVLLAADAFGAAHQLVRATVEYVKTRQQFGQPIAQFQAVKHQLANMALDVDPARGLWWYAAHAFDHAPADASRAAALAKAHITDRAQDVVRNAVEAHGGIGFTWECDVQIWFKRVMFDRLWLGAPELHRERYAQLEGW